MAENIPLLNESMNGARLAGVVDYLRHQKRDVYYGFVGPAREEGQPTNKANQAYFTQRDWLGGETLQRGAEVAFTLSYKDGKPQANDITPVEQDPALLSKKKPQKKPLQRKDTKGKLTLETLSTRVLELVDAEDGELLSANLNRRYRRKYGTDLDFRSLGFERLNQCLREVPGVSVGIGARAVVERAEGEPTTTKKKATVTCCYFLRDACDKGDACRYVHQKPLPQGERCSWGARCRFGCVPQVEKEAPAVTGDLDALAADVLKLCDQQGSILLANLPKSYQTAYKAKINPRDYGHEKLAHVLQALAGLHVETGPRGFVAREGDDVRPPPQTSTEKKPVRVVSEKASPDTLEALSTEILQVIDANEGEVLAAHLPKRYHRTFGKKLIPQDYGCEKLLELLRATPRVGCGSGPRATVTRSAPRAPAAAENDTDLANPTIDTIEVCDLGAHAPTFTPSAQ
mmetsp:Transcript_23251/g.60560  ORF Transcript_23251/g.60560 Transcript_23251/m.60560 type:complete len:458 (-) Transcript_23251:89-1462(-)